MIGHCVYQLMFLQPVLLKLLQMCSYLWKWDLPFASLFFPLLLDCVAENFSTLNLHDKFGIRQLTDRMEAVMYEIHG